MMFINLLIILAQTMSVNYLKIVNQYTYHNKIISNLLIKYYFNYSTTLFTTQYVVSSNLFHTSLVFYYYHYHYYETYYEGE